MQKLGILLSVLLLAGWLAGAGEEGEVKVSCVKDTWISKHPDELTNSMGRTPRLKMKFLQEFFLLDFDWKALEGRSVAEEGGWLYLHADMESAAKELARLKLDTHLEKLKGVPFRWVGISTVSSPWVEGAQAEEYKEDPEGKGATFLEASFGAAPWAWEHSQVFDVVHGNGHSIVARVEVERLDDGWFRAPIPKEMIDLLLAGGGHGLFVSEDTYASGGASLNGFVHSREAEGKEPYLIVKTAGDQAAAPDAPAEVKIEPAPQEAALDYGAVKMSLKAPAGTLAFHVTADGKRLEAWQIARPVAGETQSLTIRDLPPGKEIVFSVAAAHAGGVSKAVEVSVKASPALVAPTELPEPAFKPAGGDPPVRDGKLVVWAVPEGVLTDPVQAKVHFEGEGAADFRRANPVWDGASGTVRLAAARGEIVGFELLFERAGEAAVTKIAADFKALAGPGGAVFDPAKHMRRYRTWYVKPANEYMGEYAVPLDGALAVPFAKNAVEGQKLQGMLVDLHILKDAQPGAYEGAIAVSAEGVQPFELKLRLDVYSATIPDEISFNPELNSYGPPAEPGSAYFKEAYRLAHYHRCEINALPYSQSGRVREDWAAPVKDGKVTDWSNFDAKFGPLLDGSLFKDLPRAGVPVKTFYLPFCETYPLPIKQGFKWEKFGTSDEVINAYRLFGPRAHEAFTAEYREGFAAVAADFAKHFKEKGWTRSQAQFYLNNKYSKSGNIFWKLDEPGSQPDYEALVEYGKMWREGLKDYPGIQLLYRGDISRPMFMFDQFDGLMEQVYVNNGAFGYARTLAEMSRRYPYEWYLYGSCNAPGASILQTAAWCLKAYGIGANGVLPWKATGKPNFAKGETDALIVNAKDAGFDGPVASLRVHMLRRGAQDAELLNLLARKKGWTREQAGALVLSKVPSKGRFKQAFEDDAAAVEYAELSAKGFAQLKEGILKLLEE